MITRASQIPSVNVVANLLQGSMLQTNYHCRKTGAGVTCFRICTPTRLTHTKDFISSEGVKKLVLRIVVGGGSFGRLRTSFIRPAAQGAHPGKLDTCPPQAGIEPLQPSLDYSRGARSTRGITTEGTEYTEYLDADTADSADSQGSSFH